MRVCILPEEIVPDVEFGTVRRPKGISEFKGNWVAKDLDTHFLVCFPDEDKNVTAFIKKYEAVELKDIQKDKDLISNSTLKQKVVDSDSDIKVGKIRI